MAFYEDETGTVQVGALSGSTKNDLYRFGIPMMVLTTLAVALRVYVRGYMTKTFGVADWLIIPAYRYVVFGAVSIFSLYHLAFMFISTFQCGVPTVSNLVKARTDGQCIDWIHIVKPLL
ncbi:unnamed protein product [Aureobasidium mustum]|uniref:Uncharacterized protein n=1 Tax=Aureobasidium mustum TaxID=2773714 RepID=A0A9N8P7Z6_9PEZI|nr:unnamed protein product [Aureobasidium mustum]